MFTPGGEGEGGREGGEERGREGGRGGREEGGGGQRGEEGGRGGWREGEGEEEVQDAERSSQNAQGSRLPQVKVEGTKKGKKNISSDLLKHKEHFGKETV